MPRPLGAPLLADSNPGFGLISLAQQPDGAPAAVLPAVGTTLASPEPHSRQLENNAMLEDIVFFSPVRWQEEFRRPHHVACWWAATHRVSFWEQPLFHAGQPRLEVVETELVTVLVPHLPSESQDPQALLRAMLDGWFRHAGIALPIGWYWAPEMRSFSMHRQFRAIVQDCIEGTEVTHREHALLDEAQVVFASKPALYRARRHLHANIHLLPDGRHPHGSWPATVGQMKRLVAQAVPLGGTATG